MPRTTFKMDSGVRQNDVSESRDVRATAEPASVNVDRAMREVIQNPFFGALRTALKNGFWPAPE
jgi:hypothetical protein